jgi:hypothetical protein
VFSSRVVDQLPYTVRSSQKLPPHRLDRCVSRPSKNGLPVPVDHFGEVAEGSQQLQRRIAALLQLYAKADMSHHRPYFCSGFHTPLVNSLTVSTSRYPHLLVSRRMLSAMTADRRPASAPSLTGLRFRRSRSDPQNLVTALIDQRNASVCRSGVGARHLLVKIRPTYSRNVMCWRESRGKETAGCRPPGPSVAVPPGSRLHQ